MSDAERERADDVERLSREIAELRASRRRLVLAADAERHTIERGLHRGVQQLLVGLAITLQLAEQALDTDPTEARTRIEEARGDVRRLIDEAAALAHHIYPALPAGAGLAPLLRTSALQAGLPATVDVPSGLSCPPEIALAIHRCWLDVLERADGDSPLTIRVREEGDELRFDVAGHAARTGDDLDRERERVEALGGRFTTGSGTDGTSRVAGVLPLSR